jgi:sugar/nucleoside kinase (ribokinase family)
MMRYDIVNVGHVTHDILDDRGRVSRFTGGGAYFAAFAACRSGASVLVVTRLAEADFGLLSGLKSEGVDVLALPGSATTCIENVFESEDVDRRTVRLISRADPFGPEDIPAVAARIWNLTGLFRGEIPPALIPPLAARGQVALDLQGLLRTSEAGVFAWKDWEEKAEYLPHITYLKADSLEAEVATGLADREAAAGCLQALGAAEVMVTHSSEVLVTDGRETFRAPFDPANLSGRTGRGDSCFGAYLTRRLSHGIGESVRYAAALTSIKMESPGPFRGSREQVLARMGRSG